MWPPITSVDDDWFSWKLTVWGTDNFLSTSNSRTTNFQVETINKLSIISQLVDKAVAGHTKLGVGGAGQIKVIKKWNG